MYTIEFLESEAKKENSSIINEDNELICSYGDYMKNHNFKFYANEFMPENYFIMIDEINKTAEIFDLNNFECYGNINFDIDEFNKYINSEYFDCGKIMDVIYTNIKNLNEDIPELKEYYKFNKNII